MSSCEIALSECEISSMQELLVDGVMTTNCTIERKAAPSLDNQGRSTFGSPTSVSTTCRLLGLSSPKEAREAGKLVSSSLHRFWLPLATEIAEKDTILVGSQRYEVVAHDRGRSDALFLNVYAAKSNP